jgi:phosphatidylglycerol:prolipoprotein diacylglycerol transferase
VRPILFAFGSFEISSYALMLSLGACAGLWLTYRESLRKAEDPAGMLSLAVGVFIAAVIGARGLSWLVYDQLYDAPPWWDILLFWERGGTSAYGGLMLAMVVGLVWLRVKGLRAWDVADTLVFAWVPFLAITRIGCFLNGCCYGRPTTHFFGLVAGGEQTTANFGIPSHPTQLYALAALATIFCLLGWLRTHRRFEGQLAVTFCALYGLFRFFHEFLRGDAAAAWRIGGMGILTVNQILSIGLVLFALAAAAFLARGPRTRERAG